MYQLGQRDTPVVNAQGVVTLMLSLSGKKAMQFRMVAGSILVRHLGGDETLVAEIQQNRNVAETRPISVQAFMRQSDEVQEHQEHQEQQRQPVVMDFDATARTAAPGDAITTIKSSVEYAMELESRQLDMEARRLALREKRINLDHIERTRLLDAYLFSTRLEDDSIGRRYSHAVLNKLIDFYGGERIQQNGDGQARVRAASAVEIAAQPAFQPSAVISGFDNGDATSSSIHGSTSEPLPLYSTPAARSRSPSLGRTPSPNPIYLQHEPQPQRMSTCQYLMQNWPDNDVTSDQENKIDMLVMNQWISDRNREDFTAPIGNVSFKGFTRTRKHYPMSFIPEMKTVIERWFDNGKRLDELRIRRQQRKQAAMERFEQMLTSQN